MRTDLGCNRGKDVLAIDAHGGSERTRMTDGLSVLKIIILLYDELDCIIYTDDHNNSGKKHEFQEQKAL